MFLKFKKGKQKKLVQNAINKAGSERKLSMITQIPNSMFYKYKFEICNLPKNRAIIMLNYLNIDFRDIEKNIICELSDNWGRQKGGVQLIKKKIQNNELSKTILKLNKASSEWHKEQKSKNPVKYYNSQYEKFKKIGGYKEQTKLGIKVRNKLEKKICNFLHENNLQFKYEPYLKIKNKVFFPDFVVNQIVIECTYWNHPNQEKINRIKEKIEGYKSIKLRTILFIPQPHRKFYKQFDSFIVSELKVLKNIIKPP